MIENSWTWGWAIRNIIAELLMPPGIWIELALFSMVLFRKNIKLKTTLIGFSLAMIWITSTVAFSQWFLRVSDQWMHWSQPIDLSEFTNQKKSLENIKPKKAIVILGSGIRSGAQENPEYQYQDVSSETMARLRMGARLEKISHFPILVTGGRPDKVKPDDLPEGKLMAIVLDQELQTPVKWIEELSNTTQENAKFSANILKQNQIDTIYLITHHWHMPRAKMIFEKEHLKVVPVPMGYEHKQQLSPLDFFPKNEGLAKVRQVWHESLGQLWYRIRF